MFKIPFKNFNFNIKQCLKCLKKGKCLCSIGLLEHKWNEKKKKEPSRWDSLALKSGACSPRRQSAVLMHWESDLSPPGRFEMPEGQAVGLRPEKDVGCALQHPKGWCLSPGRRSSWWVNTGNPPGEVFFVGEGWVAVARSDWLVNALKFLVFILLCPKAWGCNPKMNT